MADIRASDDERERTIDALRVHAAAGRLDAAELDDRIGVALAAKGRDELARLVEDLPSEERRPARAPAPAPAVRRRAGGHLACGRHDPVSLIGLSVLVVAIWALTGMGYFWPMWPILGFALAGLSHWRAGGNTRVIGNTGVTGNTRGHR